MVRGLQSAAVIFASLCSLAFPVKTMAQGVVLDAFAKPTGMILCVGARPEPADSASIVYDVSDEAPGVDARETRVGYDSLGTPVFLSILATTQRADSAYAEAYIVRFTRPEAAVYTIGAGPLSSPVSGRERVPLESEFKMVKSRMTELDLTRARDFAKEFWTRRCQPFRVEM